MRTLLFLLWALVYGVVQASSCQEIAEQVNQQLNPKINSEELAQVLSALHRTGHLPAQFLTKRSARAAGWHPSQNLDQVLPGKSIGGDHFGNYERRLPRDDYREADLDYQEGRRGPKRLVFSRTRRYVSVDHYRNFVEIPSCK